MRERAALIGGTLDVRSAPGKGRQRAPRIAAGIRRDGKSCRKFAFC